MRRLFFLIFTTILLLTSNSSIKNNTKRYITNKDITFCENSSKGNSIFLRDCLYDRIGIYDFKLLEHRKTMMDNIGSEDISL